VTVQPQGGYAYWKSASGDGSNAVGAYHYPSAPQPYTNNSADKYVKIQTLVAHALTVATDGSAIVSGGGFYYEGESVNISVVLTQLNLPSPIGLFSPVLGPVYPRPGAEINYPTVIDVFTSWTGGNGGTFANANSAMTSFTMPGNIATVTADIQEAHKLWVSGGHIIPNTPALIGITSINVGYYLPGATIPLATSASPPAGQTFKGWKEVNVIAGPNKNPNNLTTLPDAGWFTSVNSTVTTFTMPPLGSAIVEAPWGPQVPPLSTNQHRLTVRNGTDTTGSGDYTPNFPVTVEADPPEVGWMFTGWIITGIPSGTVYPGMIVNASLEKTVYYMADYDVTIEATYDRIPYMLIVVNGTDNSRKPSHFMDEKVPIAADPPPSGQVFDKWTSSSDEGSFASGNASATTYTMPAETVIVTANYIAGNASGGRDRPAFLQRDGSQGGKSRQIFVTEHFAYIIGYPGGHVEPERNVTRAEVSMVFYRLLTDETLSANRARQNLFSDVNIGSWYNEPVSVMDKMEKVKGYPDGTFHPDSAITRAELATIAARFARQMDMSPTNNVSFSDVSGHWAAGDIRYAAEVGWIEGYPDGTFRPNRDITRAEFMTLVNRMLERVPETPDDLLADEMISWADNADPGAWYYLAVQEATNSHVPEFKDKTVPGLKFNYEYWVEMMENRGVI